MPSASGFYSRLVVQQAGRQSDKILVDLKFSTDRIGSIFAMFNESTVL